MAELDAFLSHLDSRLEPINAQLAKLAELQVVMVAIQERDKHQADELTRLNQSLGEAFQVIRANDAAATAKHDLNKERLDKLRSEFDVSSHKCTAVANKFDVMSDDYKQKKMVIYGIAIALASLGGAFKWVAADYYDRFEAEMRANKEYRTMNEAREAEMTEQLKMVTQQLRSMRK